MAARTAAALDGNGQGRAARVAATGARASKSDDEGIGA